MSMQKNKAGKGFTLVEALAVLAVFAILAAIAYPSYVESVRKGKRAEGRAALYLVMQQQERHYSHHGSYIAFSASSVDEQERKFTWFSGASAANSAYEIKAEACPDESIRDCVLLAAMPGTARVDSGYADPACGNLTLTSTGIRRAQRPDCW